MVAAWSENKFRHQWVPNLIQTLLSMSQSSKIYTSIVRTNDLKKGEKATAKRAWTGLKKPICLLIHGKQKTLRCIYSNSFPVIFFYFYADANGKFVTVLGIKEQLRECSQ